MTCPITRAGMRLRDMGLVSGGLAALSVCVLLFPRGSAAREDQTLSGSASDAAADEAEAKQTQLSNLGYLPRFAFRRQGRFLQSGLRVESDGWRVQVSDTAFGPGGQPWASMVPAHLGGGYLFFHPVASMGASSTALYRAASFTGPLTPVGRVPFVVNEAEFGFDRVYLLGTAIQAGLDLQTKTIVGLDPLPPLVTISGLSFDGAERALVSGPLVGVLYTTDQGRTWMPIPDAQYIIKRSDERGLFVRTALGPKKVLPSGQLQDAPDDPASGETPGPNAEIADGLSARPMGEFAQLSTPDQRVRALAYLVEQGATHGNTLLALRDGHLYELGHQVGVSVRSEPVPEHRFLDCRGTGASSGAARSVFVCETERGLSVLSVADQVSPLPAPARPAHGTTRTVRLLLPAAKRRIQAVDHGAVLVSGQCEDAALPGSCLVRSNWKKSFSVPAGVPGRDAYAIDGAQLVHIHLDPARRRLNVERHGGRGQQRKQYLFSPDEEDLLLSGSLLPEGSVIEGEAAVWLTLRERFVGLRLGDSKYPSAGAIQRPLSRASFAGRYAFVWGAAGFAKQSVDGGLHFTETEVPHVSGDPQLASVIVREGGVNVGCSEAGCSLGQYLRFGWSAARPLPAPTPPAVPVPSPGGGKLHFSCGSGSFTSPPRRAYQEDEVPSFWEAPPPASQAGDARFVVDFSDGLGLLYGSGPHEIPWGRRGQLQLYFVDPFGVERIQRSAATPRLFPSAARAEDELGVVDRSTLATEIAFEPAGDRGVLLVRTRDRASLFSFVADEPLVRYQTQQDVAYRGLSGAVIAGDRWYVGLAMGRSFSVVRLGAEGVEPVVELPLGDASPRGARLIRTVSGGLGVMMEGDLGLIVYPLSTEGELGQALLVPHSASRPPLCEPEAQGFIVDREWSLMPYFSSPAGAIELNELRARLIVGHGEPCLVAMSAWTRSELPREALPQRASAVPLAILNHDSTRGRAELWCQ